MSEKPCGAYFFAFFENFFVPILTSGGLAAVSSSAFAALYSAFGKYDVVHIHAEGPAFFAWLPKMFGKRVVVTVHGIDWQREKWQSGLGSKFIHQGEKNAAKYADEVIVLSKGVLETKKGALNRKIEQLSGSIVRLESQKRSSYEQYVLGKISKEKFLEPKQGLENEITTLKQTKAEKEKELAIIQEELQQKKQIAGSTRGPFDGR